MSYRPTHLWTALDAEERSMRWLARKVGCSHNYLSQLKSGRRGSVSDQFAADVAAVLGVPVTELFAPVTSVDAAETLAGVR